MKRAGSGKRPPDIDNFSFSQLIERDPGLVERRRAYARRTARERRRAAEWSYEASSANDLFNRALAMAGQRSPFPQAWPPGVEALAIDPTYAPAQLSKTRPWLR